MNSPSIDMPQTPAQLRSFGLLTGSIFAVLFGLLFPWLSERSIPLWPWIVMVVFWLPALLLPRLLQPVYSLWMKIGHVLGWINTRIILGLLFFLLFVPLGLLMRVLRQGHIQQMNNSTEASLRQPSHPRPRKHFERLF